MENPFEALGTLPLAALVDRHPASFMILSKGACTCANQAALRMFGESVVGKSIEDLVHVLPGHAFTLDGKKFLAGMGERILRGFAYPLLDDLVGTTFVDVTEDQRAQRESLALAKMASGFAWGGSLASTMESLALNAAEALNALASGVVLLEGDPPEPRHAGAYNLPPEYVACLAQLWGEPGNLMIETVQTGKIGVKRSVRQEFLLGHPAMQAVHSYLLAAPWDTVVLVPLIYQGAVLGALTCYFPRCTGRDESELRFLQAIADQAAILVQNARLIEQARDKTLLEERQRLARELHDSVSQALFGIALGARTARTLADDNPAAVKEPLDYVLSLAEAGLAEMRALIFELRPETIDSDGLVAALERQLSALQARHGLAVEGHLAGEPPLSSARRHALYRVAQEAIHNIVKHAAASRVDVELQQDNGSVVLAIKDDGKGFDGPGDVPGHLGLRSMRERMAQVGGTLSVDSQPGRGTRIQAQVPSSLQQT